MKSLKIKSSFGNYNVIFKDSLIEVLQYITKTYNAHLIIDNNISVLYKKQIELFEKKFKSFYSFEAIEKNKNLNHVMRYTQLLLKMNIQKNQVLVVIGGGLVQDIGSFTAHILKRGIRWVFIPTTLLSMSDSCIGGKSGINVGQYKNQIGAFHPPAEILITSELLHTLPKDQILNGIGEIIKHSIIKGGKQFTKIQSLLSKSIELESILESLIYYSLLIKKEIVEDDELDTGRRHLLNYGHSFGHDLEGYSHNRIPHGIAVTIGMDIANYISWKRKMISNIAYHDLTRFLRKYIPYSRVRINDFKRYVDILSRDKKVVNNVLHALLCRGVGRVETMKLNIDERLEKEIMDYTEDYRKNIIV